jgi:hypothetical protein
MQKEGDHTACAVKNSSFVPTLDSKTVLQVHLGIVTFPLFNVFPGLFRTRVFKARIQLFQDL